MAPFVLRRVGQALPVLIGTTVITFLLLVSAPGDPVSLLVSPEQMAYADYDTLRAELGLNRPMPLQYLSIMERLLTGGLRSFRERRPITTMVAEALVPTALLAAIALLLAVALAIPIALASAVRPYSALDHSVTVFSLFGISLPGFWFALVLIFVFTDRLGWLPASGLRPIGTTGYGPGLIWPHLVMPVIVLCLSILPFLVRYARSAFLETLSEEFILVARSKGLTEQRVMLRHVVRNSLIPVVTIIGLLIPFLLSGSVIVETIFAIPGIGQLAIQGALGRDYPVVMATTVLAAVLIVLSNLLSDVAYAVLDPRIRYD